jgi:hypothetical protein
MHLSQEKVKIMQVAENLNSIVLTVYLAHLDYLDA